MQKYTCMLLLFERVTGCDVAFTELSPLQAWVGLFNLKLTQINKLRNELHSKHKCTESHTLDNLTAQTGWWGAWGEPGFSRNACQASQSVSPGRGISTWLRTADIEYCANNSKEEEEEEEEEEFSSVVFVPMSKNKKNSGCSLYSTQHWNLHKDAFAWTFFTMIQVVKTR